MLRKQNTKENTGIDENQFEMVKNLELSFEQFEKIYEYCNKKGILFMSTPFDLISVDFLKNLDMPYWKIQLKSTSAYHKRDRYIIRF